MKKYLKILLPAFIISYANLGYAWVPTNVMLKSNAASDQWQLQPTDFSGNFLKIIFLNNQLYAIAEKGTQQVLLKSSDQGAHWQEMLSTLPAGIKRINAISGNKNALIAVGEGINLLVSKDDGATWKAVRLPAEFSDANQPKLNDIATDGNDFMAVGNYFNQPSRQTTLPVVLSSKDQGDSWTVVSTVNANPKNTTNEFYTVQWIDNQWMIGGLVSTNAIILMSPDAINWNTIKPNNGGLRIDFIQKKGTEWFVKSSWISSAKYPRHSGFTYSMDDGKTWRTPVKPIMPSQPQKPFPYLVQGMTEVHSNGKQWIVMGDRDVSLINIGTIPALLTGNSISSWTMYDVPNELTRTNSHAKLSNAVWTGSGWIMLATYNKPTSLCESFSGVWSGGLGNLSINSLTINVHKNPDDSGYSVNGGISYSAYTYGATDIFYGLSGQCVEQNGQGILTMSHDQYPEAITAVKTTEDNTLQVTQSQLDVGRRDYRNFSGQLGRN